MTQNQGSQKKTISMHLLSVTAVVWLINCRSMYNIDRQL